MPFHMNLVCPQFAFVHVFTKVGSGEVYLSEPSSLVGSDGGDMDWDEESEVGRGLPCSA